MFNIFLATMLHIQCLLPPCSTVLVFLANYCSDMFRPHCSAIFRELVSFSDAYNLCGNLCEGVGFCTSMPKCN